MLVVRWTWIIIKSIRRNRIINGLFFVAIKWHRFRWKPLINSIFHSWLLKISTINGSLNYTHNQVRQYFKITLAMNLKENRERGRERERERSFSSWPLQLCTTRVANGFRAWLANFNSRPEHAFCDVDELASSRRRRRRLWPSALDPFVCSICRGRRKKTPDLPISSSMHFSCFRRARTRKNVDITWAAIAVFFFVLKSFGRSTQRLWRKRGIDSLRWGSHSPASNPNEKSKIGPSDDDDDVIESLHRTDESIDRN